MCAYNVNDTVYPKKYAHGNCFAVLCCGYTLTDFPISIRLTSLALWQSNDCPSASKATLINTSCEFIMNDCITTTKQSTTKPCAYFLGYTVLNELHKGSVDDISCEHIWLFVTCNNKLMSYYHSRAKLSQVNQKAIINGAFHKKPALMLNDFVNS